MRKYKDEQLKGYNDRLDDHDTSINGVIGIILALPVIGILYFIVKILLIV